MIEISPRFTFIFLVSVSCAFLVAGCGMVMFGMYKNLTKSKIADDFDGSSSDGTVNIAAGSLDIIVGVCGLVGALMKKRIFLLANLCLLGCVLLSNVVFLIFFPISAFDSINDAKSGINKTIVTFYGVNSVAEGRQLTLEIDHHQDQDDCCGWTGIDGANIFMQTQWYWEINANKTSDFRTLPDSCCLKIDNDCRSAANVKEARGKGAVYQDDCMDKLAGRVKFYIWTTITQLILSTLMQSVVAGFCALSLHQNSAEQT